MNRIGMPSWEEIAAVLTGSAALVASLVKFRGNRETRSQRRVRETAEAESKIQDTIDQFCFENMDYVGRVEVVAARNSGDVLSIGTDRYISVLFEVTQGMNPIKPSFQGYRATDGYMMNMRDAMSHRDKVTTIDVDSETTEVNLANIYRSIGVKYDKFKYLTYRKNNRKLSDEINFLHVHIREGVELTPELSSVLDGKVNVLANIIVKYLK